MSWHKGGIVMSTLTGKDLNLVKPALTDDHKVTIGTDLPANFQKIDDEFTAHLAEDMQQEEVHGLRYEEGSWTPTIFGTTVEGANAYSMQVGKYIKIGNKVTLYGQVVLSAKDPNMAGSAKIGGLPFNAPNARGSVSFSYIRNMSYPSGEIPTLLGYVTQNRADLFFPKSGVTPPTSLPVSSIENNTNLYFTIEYYI
jgi:hypothetical protein